MYTGVPEGKESEKGPDKLFEEIMIEKCPIWERKHPGPESSK